MLESNIYEYLYNTHPLITETLKLCRAEKRFICDSASDFEKFRELCIAFPKLVGHSLFFDISESMEKLFGKRIHPSMHNCEELWRAFCGEQMPYTDIRETVYIKYADESVLRKAISLSGIKSFIKPNPYIVNKINEKYGTVGCPDETERTILTLQNIRQEAISCKARGETLILDAGNCPLKAVCDLTEYLDRSGLLPKIFVILNAEQTGENELKNILAPYEVSVGVSIGNDTQIILNKIKYASENFPIGELIFITDADESFSASVNMLRNEWIRCGLCSNSIELYVKKVLK